MSVKDLKALSIMEKTTRKVSNHYVTTVVFDCAAKFKGFSINDKLLQGPDLNNNLTGVLLHFRQESVAFAADIRSMLHQVLVDVGDRDTLHFFWWLDNDWNKPPIDYRMNVLLFGSTCSPRCAAFALRQTTRDNITGAREDVLQTVTNKRQSGRINGCGTFAKYACLKIICKLINFFSLLKDVDI